MLCSAKLEGLLQKGWSQSLNKKKRCIQKLAISKKSTIFVWFLWNWKWLPHEVIIFIKFHENWAKIVNSLLIANYLDSPIFYYSYSRYEMICIPVLYMVGIWIHIESVDHAFPNASSRKGSFLKFFSTKLANIGFFMSLNSIMIITLMFF